MSLLNSEFPFSNEYDNCEYKHVFLVGGGGGGVPGNSHSPVQQLEFG